MTLSVYYFNQFTAAQYIDFCCRLVLAFVIGGAIGLERSNRFKEAGIRTHIMVCVTSTLIMLISKYGFADMDWGTGMEYFGTKGADAARIAAQAVSGISFLCAGVIIKVGSNVKGLTTAAGIWMTSGIGLVPIGSDAYDGYHLVFTVRDSDEFEAQLRQQLKDWGAQLTDSNITWQRDGVTEFDFIIRRADSIEYTDIKEFAERFPEIVSFSYSSLTNTHMI